MAKYAERKLRKSASRCVFFCLGIFFSLFQRFADGYFVSDMIQIGACLIQTSFGNFQFNCIHLESLQDKTKAFQVFAFFLCSSFFEMLYTYIVVLKCFFILCVCVLSNCTDALNFKSALLPFPLRQSEKTLMHLWNILLKTKI